MKNPNKKIKDILNTSKKVYPFGSNSNSLRLSFKILGGVLLTGALTSLVAFNMLDDVDVSPLNQVEASKSYKTWESPYLKSNPLLNAGLIHQGAGYSIASASDKWFKAGLDIKDLPRVLMFLDLHAPTVYQSPELKEIFHQKQTENDQLIRKEFSNVIYNIENHIENPKEKFVIFNRALTDAMASRSVYDIRFDKTFSPFEIENLVEKYGSSSQGITYAESYQSLERVAQEIGVASLKLPMSYYQDPLVIASAANRLKVANYELGEATGLKGGVLGLNGVVALFIQRNYLDEDLSLEEVKARNDAAGMTIRMKEMKSKTLLNITTSWSALGHEWAHAYSFMTQRLSSSVNPTKEMVAQVSVVTPDWKFPETCPRNEGYFALPEEKLAFAFSSYLALNNYSSLYDTPTLYEGADLHFYPTAKQAIRLEPLILDYLKDSRDIVVQNSRLESNMAEIPHREPKFKSLEDRRRLQIVNSSKEHERPCFGKFAIPK